MTELRVQVEDTFLLNLQAKLGTGNPTDIARDALTLLNWAVGEKEKGRDIASTLNGRIYTTLAMPSLERIHSQP